MCSLQYNSADGVCSSILPALWRTSAQGTIWLTGPAGAPGTTWPQESLCKKHFWTQMLPKKKNVFCLFSPQRKVWSSIQSLQLTKISSKNSLQTFPLGYENVYFWMFKTRSFLNVLKTSFLCYGNVPLYHIGNVTLMYSEHSETSSIVWNNV